MLVIIFTTSIYSSAILLKEENNSALCHFTLQLLELCTDKLGLPGAARRVFLDDATEVYTADEIPRDSEVYISCGENFKDPFKGAKSKTPKLQY